MTLVNRDQLISLISPSEFPGTSGDSANYTEVILGLVKRKHQVMLICPWHNSQKTYDEKMRQRRVLVKRIPIIPPRMSDFGCTSNALLHFRLFAFYFVSIAFCFFLFLRYRVRFVIIRHSILSIPLALIFAFFKISSVADGEVLSVKKYRVLPISNATWRMLEFCERLVINKYSAYSIPSESQKDYLTRLGFPETRIFKREIAVDLGNIPVYDLGSIPKNTFGYFGSLEKWQNVEYLIRSFIEVTKEVPEARLLIIGDGSMKQYLKQLVEEHKATKSIFFLDGVTREKLWKDYFRRFRVAVIPRSSTIYPENSSIKLVEALATGKPTIATRVPGISTMIRGEDGVILVEAEDIHSMSNAILKLTSDEPLLFELSAKALRASERFEIEHDLDVLLGFLGVS